MLDFTSPILHNLCGYIMGTVYPTEHKLISTTGNIQVLVLEHTENNRNAPTQNPIQTLKLSKAQQQQISEAWPQGLVSQPCWINLRNCEDSDCVILGFEDSPKKHQELFNKYIQKGSI